MSEPVMSGPEDRLDALRAHTRRAPDPAVLGAVVARGRRKKRLAALGGVAALPALVVLATLLVDGAGVQSLRPVPPAGNGPGATASASATAGPTRSPGVAVASPLVGGRGSATPSAATASRGPAPRGTATPSAAPRTARDSRVYQPMRRLSRRAAAPAVCGGVHSGDTGTVAESWCATAAVEQPGEASADGVDLVLELCRSQEQPASGRQDFADDREVDFLIRDASGAPRWRWSTGLAFPPRPHAMTWRPGECRSWRTLWQGRDGNGQALTAGSYELVAELRTESFGVLTRTTTFNHKGES